MKPELKEKIEYADKIGQTKDKYKEKQHKRAVQLVTLRNALSTKLLATKDKYDRVRHAERMEYLQEKNSF